MFVLSSAIHKIHITQIRTNSNLDSFQTPRNYPAKYIFSLICWQKLVDKMHKGLKFCHYWVTSLHWIFAVTTALIQIWKYSFETFAVASWLSSLGHPLVLLLVLWSFLYCVTQQYHVVFYPLLLLQSVFIIATSLFPFLSPSRSCIWIWWV